MCFHSGSRGAYSGRPFSDMNQKPEGRIPFLSAPESRKTANLFFNLIAKRYEKSSTIITTNLTFSKWPEVFNDYVLTNALLHRLLHHSSVLSINGPSYGLKDQLQFIVDED